jgi:hypothetical protein
MGNFPFYPHINMVVTIEDTVRQDRKCLLEIINNKWLIGENYGYLVVATLIHQGYPSAKLRHSQYGNEIIIQLSHIKPRNMSYDDCLNYLSFHLSCAICGKKMSNKK